MQYRSYLPRHGALLQQLAELEMFSSLHSIHTALLQIPFPTANCVEQKYHNVDGLAWSWPKSGTTAETSVFMPAQILTQRVLDNL